MHYIYNFELKCVYTKSTLLQFSCGLNVKKETLKKTHVKYLSMTPPPLPNSSL